MKGKIPEREPGNELGVDLELYCLQECDISRKQQNIIIKREI